MCSWQSTARSAGGCSSRADAQRPGLRLPARRAGLRARLHRFRAWALTCPTETLASSRPSRRRPGDLDAFFAPAPSYNPFLDLHDYARRILAAKRLGIFTVGGGVPRNWAQQVGPVRRHHQHAAGHEAARAALPYAVRLCPEPVHWGGLSGCTYTEGVSWGKFLSRDEGGRFAEVHCDATIAWPLLIRAVLERGGRQRAEGRPAVDPSRSRCPIAAQPSAHPLTGSPLDPTSSSACPRPATSGPTPCCCPCPSRKRSPTAPGTAGGPAAIIAASLQIETFDEETLVEFAAGAPHPHPAAAAGRRRRWRTTWRGSDDRVRPLRDKFLVALGGEHTVTYGVVAGSGRRSGRGDHGADRRPCRHGRRAARPALVARHGDAAAVGAGLPAGAGRHPQPVARANTSWPPPDPRITTFYAHAWPTVGRDCWTRCAAWRARST